MADKKPLVLIADDTPANLQILGSMLEQAGCEVQVAIKGAEALATATLHPQPNLILLDIMMPGMDGMEVCARLKADPRTASIPVIFISALDDPARKVAAFRHGAVDYVTKPFQAEEVVARVRTHLRLTRIEELERLVAERERSEADLHRAQRIAHLGSWSWNIPRGTLEWSDELYSIFGLDPATFDGDQGRIVTESVHPDDRARIERWNQAVADLVRPPPMEFRIVRPDGSVRSVWGEMGDMDLDEDGKPVVVRGIIQDITDRKRTENALRQSEAMFQLFFNSVKDSISVVRFDDGKPSNFVQVNDAACLKLGYTREEMSELSLKDVTQPEFAERFPAFLERLRSEGQILFEVEQVAKNGSRVPMEVSVSMFELDGRPATLAVARDLTERRKAQYEMTRLEDQLRQAQKLEAIGRLAGGVAHDFNNMLGVIHGHTELVMLKMQETDPAYPDMRTILQATHRSADLTRQLLTFARKETLSPKSVDLSESMESLLKMLRRLIGEDISVVWKPAPDLWPVLVDPTQLDQILTNLCLNARDAIRDVGKIRIEAVNVHIDDAQRQGDTEISSGDYVRITVTDDGCGMDEDTISRIFEPFFTTKPAGSGTGLGLSTVYGAARQNRGFVGVESRPGYGTTFSVHLRRADGLFESRAPARRTDSAGSGERILLVEDDPMVLGLTRTILELHGYRVQAVNSAKDAVVASIEQPDGFDLLLTDVIMPEMNGRDLKNQLRALSPRLRHLFVSGFAIDAVSRRGLVGDDSHFLQKPFSMKELASKVREILDRDDDPDSTHPGVGGEEGASGREPHPTVAKAPR